MRSDAPPQEKFAWSTLGKRVRRVPVDVQEGLDLVAHRTDTGYRIDELSLKGVFETTDATFSRIPLGVPHRCEAVYCQITVDEVR